MRKKILYFTHVPWNWIKQRPQFIAEELAEKFDIDIFQEKPYVSNLVSGTSSTLNVVTLFRLPMNRISLIRSLNAWMISIQLKKYIKKYDYVWLTSPTLFKSVKNRISDSQIVIYDCMDDILAFPAIANDAVWKKEMEKAELALLQRANIILCTSQHLKEKLISRYKFAEKDIHIANNAITIYKQDTEIALPEHVVEKVDWNKKNLTYIGTISAWFDFEMVLKILNTYPDLVVYLFGPTEVEIPRHERLVHFGPVPHEMVYTIMKKAGVLIMPFILNELILSVNPVKLYEYIYCEKIVIAKKYGETLKFDKYVYLYDQFDEFNTFVNAYCANNLELKQPLEAYQEFGLDNTWKNRVLEIEKFL